MPHQHTPRAIVVVRHGETEWSREGRHTGRADIPLTSRGREQAQRLRPLLAEWDFGAVFASPLRRARETCELAGYGDRAIELEDLMEWDYGDYEGMTWREIREARPDWSLWRDGVQGGERLDDVAGRAARVLTRAGSIDGDVLLVAHGHLLRVLTALWLALPPAAGQRFELAPAAPAVLGHEHDWTVVRRWNVEPCA